MARLTRIICDDGLASFQIVQVMHTLSVRSLVSPVAVDIVASPAG